MSNYSNNTVLNTGDHVLIFAPQLPTPSYLQLVTPPTGTALQVFAAATNVSEPYSAEYNVFVVVRAQGWTPQSQLVYLLSPWFGYLQVISPGIFGMSYRVSPNNQFDVPGLSAWSVFLASWTQKEGQPVIWNFGFANPNDGSQLLQLVNPAGGGNSLILEPVSDSSSSSYTNFTLVALSEGTNYPAC